LTFQQYLKIHLPGAMKMEKGKKRLRKKKAKKDLIERWELLEEVRILEERKRAAIEILEAEGIPYKHLLKPKDDYFSSFLMEAAMESAMGAITDAFCSIPRRRYPTQVPKS
jgi:hypothetical protein